MKPMGSTGASPPPARARSICAASPNPASNPPGPLSPVGMSDMAGAWWSGSLWLPASYAFQRGELARELGREEGREEGREAEREAER
jgi:hypothetical protein